MQFVEAIKTCLTKKYVDFNGRASRSEFWYFYLFQMLLTIPMYIVMQILSAVAQHNQDTTILVIYAFVSILMMIVSLALLLPGLGVAVRRLHDIGKSGWYYLLGFICCIGGLILIYFYAQESDGDNEYGPVPED